MRSDLLSKLRRVEEQLRRGVLDQEGLIRGLLVALLADGHLLIEGVPGLAKTRAVHLLARACHLDFKRLQFTPDLLPADVVGTRIYNQQLGGFEVVRGPVFAHLVLADEINRAPAKVQSALLETMQERQVTLGRETHPLPAPFLVFATQNPIEQEGTYPLPEAQLDRFLMKLVVTYPSREREPEIVRLVLSEAREPEVEAILTADDVLELQRASRAVFLEDRLIRYGAELVHATRDPLGHDLELAPYVEYGASPRASIALAVAAQATALLEGRDAATPDDVKAVAHGVLRHRIVTTYYADAEGVTTDRIVDEILATVKVP
jgi:MoxR-like ATPase